MSNATQQLVLPALAVALLGGCTTLSTLNGAVPLEPGRKQHTVAVKYQAGGGNLIANTGITLPGFEYQRRAGIVQDVDWGLRIHTGGVMADVRYRFWQYEGWHWAINPTIGGVGIPSLGNIEARLPLLVEKRIDDAWSVGGGSAIILRDQWTVIDNEEIGKGSDHRLDVYAGGNLRLEHRNPRDKFAWALSVDAYGQPARHGNLIVTGGVQLNWRTPKRPTGKN